MTLPRFLAGFFGSIGAYVVTSLAVLACADDIGAAILIGLLAAKIVMRVVWGPP